MGKAISVWGLKKSYDKVLAVDNIGFDVDEGSLFAFLGVNGAGKSTTINILCTLLSKDAGKVTVCGHDLDTAASAIRRDIGVIFQRSVLDDRLTVKENLTARASFYGIYGEEWKRRLEELSDLLELDELLPRRYGKLSGGQRRRADVARGLINSPKLLFLDEPTTGLDPQTRRNVWSVVDKLRATGGMTVFLTTHYMEEANEADKVVIIDEGRVVATGTPVGLKNRYSSDCVKLYSAKSALIESRTVGREVRFENDCYRIGVRDSRDAREFITANADIMDDFEVVKGDMDDVFLRVTGKTLTEVGQ